VVKSRRERISYADELNEMVQVFERSADGLLTVSARDSLKYEKGTYVVIFAKPTKRLATALSLDREIAVLFTTFRELQARTINALKSVIDAAGARLESTVAIVVHKDPRGSNRLKNWGRDTGISVLPVLYNKEMTDPQDFENLLCAELYSHDPFDITGPVSGDLHFFGRRTEAQDLARKLRHGQIRSALGIRKIGKTSILNRIVSDARESYPCTCVMIDCSRDEVWQMNEGQLLQSIAIAVETSLAERDWYESVQQVTETCSVAGSTKRLRQSICNTPHTVILFFDEIDYITPSSPTASHWSGGFNAFWRNLRSVYQEISRESQNLSMLVCGVSSKWFLVESIAGVENAALSLLPEEYLSPLPRGATVAMIKRLGRTAGLQFDEPVATQIGEACADMPFWVRKACSYIHRNIDLTGRPLRVTARTTVELLDKFVRSDGASLAQVALRHLFRVFPELAAVVRACKAGESTDGVKKLLSVLEKYGVISMTPAPHLAGEMMRLGFDLYVEEAGAVGSGAVEESTSGEMKGNDISEWADELALVNRRRNILEKRLRSITLNFIRADSLRSPHGASVVDRICAVLPAARRKKSANAEELIETLYWKELVSLIADKEWSILGQLFGDKTRFRENCVIINDRPDAHAKSVDGADLALYRRSLKVIEDMLVKVM